MRTSPSGSWGEEEERKRRNSVIVITRKLADYGTTKGWNSNFDYHMGRQN